VGPAPPTTATTATSEPVVLYAGRLSEEKGPDVIVRAAARLPEGLRVEIAGDGPRRADLERLAADVAPGRVHFHGRLPKDQLDERLAACRLVVVPSRCHENQPMSILEAYGFGTPVVASRLGGIPELVVEGTTGLLVDHDDPAALADAIATVAADPQHAAEMGRAGRALVEEGFTPDIHLAGLERLYHEAGAPVTAAPVPAPLSEAPSSEAPSSEAPSSAPLSEAASAERYDVLTTQGPRGAGRPVVRSSERGARPVSDDGLAEPASDPAPNVGADRGVVA
jgi:hypothetical protein